MNTKLALALLCSAAVAPVFAQQWDTLYHSKNANWVTAHEDLAICQKYKTNIDSIAHELDAAIPLVYANLGIGPEKLPQRVQVDPDTDGMGGWAAGSDVGYQISDFFGRPKNGDGLRWIRGVIIGEVINASTGPVTDNWPRDWWVDDVWYFPGFMAGEILKETVSPEFSKYWLTSESYDTYPVYNIFTKLLEQGGWEVWKKFFTLIKDDKMKWGAIGANPSKIKTDYVIAYLSLAAGRNMGAEFKAAKLAAADTAEVGAIMYVERGLRQADKDKKNTTTIWSDFRKGNHASARTKLDGLGVVVGVRPTARFNREAPYRIYSLRGQDVSGREGINPAPGYYILRNIR
jgi:hypothetical protein